VKLGEKQVPNWIQRKEPWEKKRIKSKRSPATSRITTDFAHAPILFAGAIRGMRTAEMKYHSFLQMPTVPSDVAPKKRTRGD
jgi:hypothetical protein